MSISISSDSNAGFQKTSKDTTTVDIKEAKIGAEITALVISYGIFNTTLENANQAIGNKPKWPPF